MVLCTQTLEHVSDPLVALHELYRVTQPGGALWLSAPFTFEEHEQPYDFYRYTRFGLRYLVEGAGWAVENLDWQEGYLTQLGYELRTAARSLPLGPARYGGGARGIMAALLAWPLRPALRSLAAL